MSHGPVRCTDANYRLSVVANARSELLADTSAPTVPISGRSHAVDSGPVTLWPCPFCSDRKICGELPVEHVSGAGTVEISAHRSVTDTPVD